ncbi:Replication factor C, subunit RFC4 [Coemansia sp. RSA 720]|nr:Replication factor C, subunit RFC4 [Coemansia sp. RSA 720]
MATRYEKHLAEQKELEDAIFRESMLALGATFVGASALSALAYRFSPAYRSTPISAKTAFILAPAIGVFYVRGEQVGTQFRRNKFAHQLEGEERAQIEERMRAQASRKTIVDRAAGFVMENQWKILGYTWLTGMGGAALYLYRKKGLAVSQKVVQARMYAQLITIIGILSMAGVASMSGKKDDKHTRRNSAELDAILANDTRIPIPKNNDVENKVAH